MASRQDQRLNRIEDRLDKAATPTAVGDAEVSTVGGRTSFSVNEVSKPKLQTITIRAVNATDYMLAAYRPLVTHRSPYSRGDRMLSDPLVYVIPFPPDNEGVLCVCPRDIPPGGVDYVTIAGACLVALVGGGPSYSCEMDYGFNQFCLRGSNLSSKRYPVLWEEYGVVPYTSPHKALILIGGGGSDESATPGEKRMTIVATLPELPDPEVPGVVKEVFWGNASVIEGGTGDNQIWKATWKDTRWYPERPTTKSGAYVPPEE